MKRIERGGRRNRPGPRETGTGGAWPRAAGPRRPLAGRRLAACLVPVLSVCLLARSAEAADPAPAGDPDETRVYFCFSLPYQMQQFEAFWAQHRQRPGVEHKVLGVSEQGRPIPLLEFGNPAAEQHLLFTCRHHACECTASYLLEGLLLGLLGEACAEIREEYRVHVFPCVDIDGVENGDQGKARSPHDHCEDYNAAPRYKATAAVMDLARDLDVVVAIDFHCPGKWGGWNDYPFFSEGGSPREEIAALGGHLARITASGPASDRLVYAQGYDVAMGEKWNRPESTTCKRWFALRGARMATTFELPYFGIGENVVTQASARRFGQDFAAAVSAYLEDI